MRLVVEEIDLEMTSPGSVGPLSYVQADYFVLSVANAVFPFDFKSKFLFECCLRLLVNKRVH